MNDQNEESGIYYYHADHLGSSSVVTDKNGKFHEHLEYFPYGETWINDRANNEDLPYRFTGKELDPETGLYYYGARYYDARLSRWISADPPLATGEYLPSGEKKQDANLPGMGGVFNSINLNAYQYCFNKPIIVIDPDGNHGFITGLARNIFWQLGRDRNLNWMRYDYDAKILTVNSNTLDVTGTFNLWQMGGNGGRRAFSWSNNGNTNNSIFTLAWNQNKDAGSGKKHSAYLVRIDEIKEDVNDYKHRNEGRQISGMYWEIDPETGEKIGEGIEFKDLYIKRENEGQDRNSGFEFITGVQKDTSDHEKHNVVVQKLINYFSPNDPQGEGSIK